MKSQLLLILLMLPALAWAQPQQSENFQITKSVIDAGGAASASENFQLVSAFGQPSPLGAQTSESFNLWAGFLTPTVAISPLSPIQALVIQAAQPNVLLAWERIASANSYKIYRDTTAIFTPGPGNYLDAVGDTAYYDATAIGLPPIRHYYIVTASSDAPPSGELRRIPDFRADARKESR
ncbi:hypothetical protein KKH27_11015 [bacterium]|nr:hypothetical protein [bacterium]MBU1985028.1 hypothetical protein [bacterium]